MSILEPIENISKALTQNLPPPRVCENPDCNKVVPVGDGAINVIHIIQVGSPGHPGITAFQCPASEHWACSPACWVVVAHACIDEHLFPIIEQVHARLNYNQSKEE